MNKIFEKIKIYFQEVRSEFKKVNWPTKKEIIRHTMFVIGISLAVALFLGGLDYLFTFLLKKFVF